MRTRSLVVTIIVASIPVISGKELSASSISHGVLLLGDAGQMTRLVVEAESTWVTTSVTGGLLQSSIRQSFAGRSDEAVEATYYTPVPSGATLRRLQIERNGVVAEGDLSEVKLEESEGRTFFHAPIGWLAPSQVASVTLSYDQPLTPVAPQRPSFRSRPAVYFASAAPLPEDAAWPAPPMTAPFGAAARSGSAIGRAADEPTAGRVEELADPWSAADSSGRRPFLIGALMMALMLGMTAFALRGLGLI
jgi:Vault protein inter-alpha-trypsin domain